MALVCVTCVGGGVRRWLVPVRVRATTDPWCMLLVCKGARVLW
jgi:hypothetical protein